jgi:hypothetical protein
MSTNIVQRHLLALEPPIAAGSLVQRRGARRLLEAPTGRDVLCRPCGGRGGRTRLAQRDSRLQRRKVAASYGCISTRGARFQRRRFTLKGWTPASTNTLISTITSIENWIILANGVPKVGMLNSF